MAYPGRIYRIVGGDKVYYGSTKDCLSDRWKKHKYTFTHNIKKTSACKIFEEYKFENCIIELVEEYPCDSRKELEIRESFYIRNYPCINDNNKMDRSEYRKLYRKATFNCECGSTVLLNHRARHLKTDKHTACL